MNGAIKFLIELPQRIAAYFLWSGPLLARIVVGYVFMLSGWGKLHNLPAITENFIGWGIPFPHILTPFVSGVEFFGGLFIILGLLTRIAGGALAVVMVVAIVSAKLMDIDSLETLLGFEEATYFAVFFWLASAGAGKASLDYLLERKLLRSQTATRRITPRPDAITSTASRTCGIRQSGCSENTMASPNSTSTCLSRSVSLASTTALQSSR